MGCYGLPAVAASGGNCLEYYGKWQGVYTRFRRWRNDGTLEKVFRALSSDADMENLSIDSTSVKMHESANGGVKKGNLKQ